MHLRSRSRDERAAPWSSVSWRPMPSRRLQFCMSEAVFSVLNVLKASGDFGVALLQPLEMAPVDLSRSGTRAPIPVPLDGTLVPLG